MFYGISRIQSTHSLTNHICLCHSLCSVVMTFFLTVLELPVLVGSARPKFVVSLPPVKEGSGELDMENYVQVKILSLL